MNFFLFFLLVGSPYYLLAIQRFLPLYRNVVHLARAKIKMGTSASHTTSETYQHMHDCLTDACLGTHHMEQENLLETLEHNNETTIKHIAELEEKLRKGELNFNALKREVAAMSAMQAEEVKNHNGAINNNNTKQALELHTSDLQKAKIANEQTLARAAELQAQTTNTDAIVQALHSQVMTITVFFHLPCLPFL